jgi:pilus assembly protein CpaF
VITVQEIFAFELMGVDDEHRVKGRFITTGIRPKFMKRLEAMGLKLPSSLFHE